MMKPCKKCKEVTESYIEGQSKYPVRVYYNTDGLFSVVDRSEESYVLKEKIRCVNCGGWRKDLIIVNGVIVDKENVS